MKWYHVSPDWIDKKIEVFPRLVREDDGKIGKPCICVAPSPHQALIAVGDFYVYPVYGVYQTIGKPTPHKAFDSVLTQEHRFFESKIFHRIGEISIDSLDLPELDLCGENDAVILKNLRIILEKLNKSLKSFG